MPRLQRGLIPFLISAGVMSFAGLIASNACAQNPVRGPDQAPAKTGPSFRFYYFVGGDKCDDVSQGGACAIAMAIGSTNAGPNNGFMRYTTNHLEQPLARQARATMLWQNMTLTCDPPTNAGTHCVTNFPPGSREYREAYTRNLTIKPDGVLNLTFDSSRGHTSVNLTPITQADLQKITQVPVPAP
jgi:hypothetical protein